MNSQFIFISVNVVACELVQHGFQFIIFFWEYSFKMFGSRFFVGDLRSCFLNHLVYTHFRGGNGSGGVILYIHILKWDSDYVQFFLNEFGSGKELNGAQTRLVRAPVNFDYFELPVFHEHYIRTKTGVKLSVCHLVYKTLIRCAQELLHCIF